MSKTWLKLDTDFFSDPKIELLVAKNGEKTAWFWLKIVAISYEIESEISLFDGQRTTRVRGAIDMKDDMSRIHLESRMGLSSAKLRSVVDKCCDCGLFDKQLWESAQVITSERMLAQGEAMARSREAKREAGRRSGESRRARASAASKAE